MGETSVLIAVSSAHRGAAFDACRYVIDTLKKTVPIWKREHFADGAVWADGEPFPEDLAAGARSMSQVAVASVLLGRGAWELLITGDAASALRAQQQQPPAPIERKEGQTPTIHVESRLVNVALNVVDETGAPVGGLTRDDFEIAEDGKPQKIAIFDRESTTPLEIVLAIDASESVLGDEHLEVQAAKKFVQSILRPQDAIDVMQFADDVTELVPFTNDERRIDNGLGRSCTATRRPVRRDLSRQPAAQRDTVEGRSASRGGDDY